MSRACAWCKKTVAEDEPVYMLPLSSKIDLSNLHGLYIPLTLFSGEILIAFVPTKDSDAWKNGIGLMMMACCEECLEQMKNALKNDMQTFAYMDEASKR